MKLKFHNCIILILIHTILTTAHSSAALCNHTCGRRKLPFPFGFSAACQIQLNCSANGAILAAGFPIQSVNAETILVNLPAVCGRPVEALRRLFTANLAPTSHNAVLLHDCRNQSSGCLIPTTMVQTHFERLDCGAGNATVSCYSEPDGNTTSFIDYGKLARSGCRSLFSAISMEAYSNSSSVSLDVQVVRVGWWLRGGCRCSRNARCVRVSPPPLGGGETTAYRCECFEGFNGDGFLDGVGCRKESEACNPSNYLSGKCGGTTRVVVLVGGVGAGASLMLTLGLLFCFIRKRSKLRSRSKKSKNLLETSGITIPIYSYKEMEKAADFFSDKRRLGNGAYGTVYRGKLSNDTTVAIKRIRHRDSIDQVINEIKLLSSVSHPNLNEVNLAALAVDRIGRGCLDEIIDPFLRPSIDLSVHKVAELAFRCLAFHRDMRPTMMEVAIELEQIRMSKWGLMKVVVKKHEYDVVGFFSSTDSMDAVTDCSPVSAAESWQSDQSSPSSNSLLNRAPG
ncbi:hypothetical protein SASPL_137834 [Salvia splendens]|uniref:Protein kinase domain-containing protein n=1 Tax=Salvia splendens TaxID=180675 RepID=A0A8X8WVJ9_SALSN|nr:hypothetical protein SASPL_137834 [Salvia splendens]